MLPYRYQPLKHDDSVRVLVLHPNSDGSSPVKCTIRHARLSDPSLEYEALSYTWGDASCRLPISFHNLQRELHINRSCHNALRHLRRKDTDRLMWIDAICINQENISERSAQVRMMDRIFATALQVVVHLGEETPGSCVLFEELAEADRIYSITGAFDRPPPNNVIVQELNELIRRPWFQRIWVIQEVHVNDSVIFMCGSASASWDSLCECILGYSMNTLVTNQWRPYVLPARNRAIPSYAVTALNLWHLLFETRDCLATDPRDRIFALRSLISSSKEEMDPLVDYHRSVEETFEEVALFLLPVVGLRLLTAVRHPHDLGMPSWVPDWSQNLPLSVAFFDFKNFDSSFNRKFLDSPESLRSCEMHNDDDFSIHTYLLSNPSSMELHAKGLRYARVASTGESFVFNGFEDTKKKMIKTYCHTKALMEYSGAVLQTDGKLPTYYFGPEIIDAMEHLNGESLHIFLTQYDGSLRGENDFFNFYNILCFQKSLHNCRLFLTDSGYLGIASEAVCTGDVVCILKGADSPCVLRQKPTGRWALISGDCPILDEKYEDGEATIFSCDSYLMDQRGDLEEFYIQ